VTDKQNKPLHIYVLAGVAASLLNFDGPLIKAPLAAGYRVTLGPAITIPILLKSSRHGVARAGMNPIADMQTRFATLVQHG
jgi:hypothetical protein